MTILRPVLRRALLRRVLTSLTDDEGAGPTITGAGSIDVSTFKIGTTQTITAGTATATGGGTVTYEYRHLAGGEVKSTSAAYAHVSGDVGESAAAQWRAVESGGTNDGATSWQTVATGTVVAQAAPAATGIESASEVGTAVFASMSSPAALGVESVSEVGFAALASSFAPAATGVESASEVGAAVFMGMSAPAATGIESASEVGTASPPSADTTAPVMTSDSYDEGTTTFSATITETESLPVTMHVLVDDTEPTTANAIINGTGLLKTSYTVSSGANSDDLEFSTVSAGTHWLGIIPVDASGNSDFAQAHVAQYTFPGGYVATGVESVSEVGTAVFASMAAPAATGVESASEVGTAVFAGAFSPAATGVESASEIGTASVSSISAPAANGVESVSEVGTAEPPSGGSTSFTMLADLYNETDTTSYTFSSQTEANIICVVGRRGSGTNAAPSAVTMNGNTCTELASSAFGTDVISFWKCPDADGTSSGDLVVTFSDTQARAFARTAYVEGFDLSGSVSDSAFDMNNDNSAGSLSLDCPAGGIIFACARLHTLSGDLANDEASSYEVPAAWEIFAGAQTAFSITLGNSGASDQLGGAISLAAA